MIFSRHYTIQQKHYIVRTDLIQYVHNNLKNSKYVDESSYRFASSKTSYGFCVFQQQKIKKALSAHKAVRQQVSALN